MKYVGLIFIQILLIGNLVIAQDPARRDTVWGDWPDQPYYDGILSAPVVVGESVAENITPTGQKLCFDKKVRIKSMISSGPVEQCMYINTVQGYVGIIPPRRSGGGPELCDIKTDDPKFLFYVLGLKGNAYTFKNAEKNGTIEHWVSTGNTQLHQANLTGPYGNYTVHKKTERRGYCGDKIKTWAYKYDNPSSPVYFLFGKTFPEEINVSSNKFIGNFGVGYQFTDKGLYIIMEMESSNYSCKITELEEVNVFFDPAPFKIAEDEFFNNATAGIQKEREKIARDEARIGNECVSQKMAVIEFRKEQVRLQEARLYTSQQGNVYQDPATQQAMAQMMDYTAMTKQMILENDVKICQAQQRLSQTRSQSSIDRYQQRISCLETQNGQLRNLEAQLMAIDIQYTSQPGMAVAEKSKKFMQGLPRACN